MSCEGGKRGEGERGERGRERKATSRPSLRSSRNSASLWFCVTFHFLLGKSGRAYFKWFEAKLEAILLNEKNEIRQRRG